MPPVRLAAPPRAGRDPLDVLDQLAVFAVVNADEPGEALLDQLGDIVEQAVDAEGNDGTDLRRTLAGHLVCTILGRAADALLDLQAAPEDAGAAVRAALISGGQSPLLARLAGAVTTKALSTLVNAQLGHITLILCAATVALCPEESRHPDHAVIARCAGHLTHETVAGVGKNTIGHGTNS